MKQLVIIGAGGHGRVAADIARLSGKYTRVLFLDDNPGSGAPGCGIAGRVSDYHLYLDNSDFFVAIGNNQVREKIQSCLETAGAQVAVLLHPNAVIGSDVKIGDGTAVMAGAVINAGAVIGRGVIVNTCSSVDHDCTVGDYSHISVGARLAGTVTLGKNVMVGAGAVVINNLSVCGGCVIGAGAVIVKDIHSPGTYVGVPGKLLE